LLTLYYRVLTIYDTGMANRVMHTARRAIATGDHPGEAFYGIGVIFEKMGRPHKALEAYQEAIRANPTQTSAYFRVARLYIDRGDDLHQYLFLKEAVKASPADRFHFSALYYNLAPKLDWYGITRIMQKVLEVDPGNVTAHVHLAWALETLGENYQSKQVIQRMMTIEARSPEELESKSWAARRVGDDGQAEALLRRSTLLDRARPDPHRELARLYKRQGRVAEARGEFEKAAQMGGYENPNEWLEYCALYENVQLPQICTQSKLELSRTYAGPIWEERSFMQVIHE
jgi:Tfp pilus assembly protein PilF